MSASSSATSINDSGAPGHGPGRSRYTRPAVTLPIVAVVLAAVLAVVLINRRPSGPGTGEAIVQVDGTARVVRADGAAVTVTGAVRLEPGDRIALRTGTATFELAKGVRYEGRGPAGSTAGTDLRMSSTPTLEAGPLLMTTGAETTTLRSSATEVRLSPGAAARLERSYAVRLSSYRGTAVFDSAGVQRQVPALRSADAVGDGELTGVEPLRYDAADRWDRRYLANAIYLDGQLGPLRRGIDAANLAPVALLDAVRTEVADRPSVTSLDTLGARRGLGVDLAIGVAVAGSGDRSVPLDRRLDRAFAFHDDGAPWGLVAMDLGADPTRVLAALRDALDGRDVAVALASASTSSGPVAGTAPGSADPGIAVGTDGAGAPGSVGPDPGVPGTNAPGGGSAADPGGPPSATPGGNLPGANVPGANVPGANVPGANVPRANVPGATVPGANVPGANVPGPNVPEANISGIGVPGTPGVTVPPVRFPPVQLPPVTVPPVKLPPVTVPPVKLPPVNLPPVIVPPLSVPLLGGTTITTPPVTTPPILGPVLGGLNGSVGGVNGGFTGTVNGTVGGLGGLGGLLGT